MKSCLYTLVLWSITCLSASANVELFNTARNNDLHTISAFAIATGDVSTVNDRADSSVILVLYYACNEAAKQFVTLGADACAVDKNNSTAYMGAAFKGHVNTAKWMHNSCDCAVNRRGYDQPTTLMIAIIDHKAIIQHHSLAPLISDYRGNSAISIAEWQEFSQVVNIIAFYRAGLSSAGREKRLTF